MGIHPIVVDISLKTRKIKPCAPVSCICSLHPTLNSVQMSFCSLVKMMLQDLSLTPCPVTCRMQKVQQSQHTAANVSYNESYCPRK